MGEGIPDSNQKNLLEEGPPRIEEPVGRIHFLARVLAYGALLDQWSPRFTVNQLNPDPTRRITEESWKPQGRPDYKKCLTDYLEDKWNRLQPRAEFLESFGYFQRIGAAGESTDYILTDKAFSLLEKPAEPPTVFVSYCHKTSSAFAMMIDYRLEAEGIPVYTDRRIPKGDDWHNRLEGKIKQSRFFVCLITAEALESEYVKKEILWAENQIRIPIWHPDFPNDGKGNSPTWPRWLEEFIRSKNAIRVLEESAEAYHDAAEKLLNALGYAFP